MCPRILDIDYVLATKDPNYIQNHIRYNNQKNKIMLTSKGLDLFKLGCYLYYSNCSNLNEPYLRCVFNNSPFFIKYTNLIQHLLWFFIGPTDKYKLKIVSNKTSPKYLKQGDIQHEKVILFSGGLDSLSQVIQSMERGEEVLLCYTSHNTNVTSKVEALVKELKQIYQTEINIVKILYYMKLKPSVMNCRAATYALNGIAMGDAVGAKEVLIPENGAMATLPKFDISIEPTRTVSPYMMEKIAQLAYEFTGIKLIDPLANQTKAEALKMYKDYEELIKFTYSCSHPSRFFSCGFI